MLGKVVDNPIDGFKGIAITEIRHAGSDRSSILVTNQHGVTRMYFRDDLVVIEESQTNGAGVPQTPDKGPGALAVKTLSEIATGLNFAPETRIQAAALLLDWERRHV